MGSQGISGALNNNRDRKNSDMTFFNLIFFKYFQFSKKIGNVDDDGTYAFKAVGIMTLFCALNLFSLIGYFKCLVEHSNSILLPTIYYIAILVMIGTIFYLCFLRNNKYVQLFEKIEKDSQLKGLAGTLITIAYMTLTIIFLMGLVWINCS